MARTFPQPDRKETPTQRLQRELKEAEAQRDCYIAEASDLRKQINGKLEDTDSYKNLAKQLADMTLQRNMASKQRDRYKAQVDELREQLAKLRSDYETLRSQLQNISIGRPLAYTDRIDKILQMRENGQSIRTIAKNLDIPSATVARYIKMYQNK